VPLNGSVGGDHHEQHREDFQPPDKHQEGQDHTARRAVAVHERGSGAGLVKGGAHVSQCAEHPAESGEEVAAQGSDHQCPSDQEHPVDDNESGDPFDEVVGDDHVPETHREDGPGASD